MQNATEQETQETQETEKEESDFDRRMKEREEKEKAEAKATPAAVDDDSTIQKKNTNPGKRQPIEKSLYMIKFVKDGQDVYLASRDASGNDRPMLIIGKETLLETARVLKERDPDIAFYYDKLKIKESGPL